jgi:lysophospholipase L1-like esterase
MIEIGARVLAAVQHGAGLSLRVFDPDHARGYRLRAHARGLTVTTNSLGFRSPEIAPSKPVGTVRIVAVGESTTFGTELAGEHTYPARLEAKLNASDGDRRYEVINAGVPGYASYHHVAWAPALVSLRPDIAVLFVGWNDFWLAYAQGERWQPNTIDPAIPAYYTSFLYNESMAYRAFERLRRWIVYTTKRSPKAAVVARYEKAATNEAMFRAYRRNVESIVGAFVRGGGRVYLVRYPCLVRKEMTDEERDAVQRLEPFWEEFLPFITAQERLLAVIDAVAGERGLETIDLDGAFARFSGAARAALFIDIIHFSARGNEVIAEELLKRIGPAA